MPPCNQHCRSSSSWKCITCKSRELEEEKRESLEDVACCPLFIPHCPQSKSSGCISTTIPELLHRDPRLEGDIPLTTTCSGPLAAGTMNPPGHMQKLYTPRPSTWVTKLYSAAGRYFPRPFLEWYCIWSIHSAGCSRRTPTAIPFASIVTLFAANQRYTSRAECPVASITGPRNVRPVLVSIPLTSSFSIIRASIRVRKWTSPPQSIMVFRMFSITRGNLSVPICGWASARMASDAPCWQNTFKILSTLPRFLLRV